MPHVNSSGGDDLTSTDEVKVYKDEGEEENRSSENLQEDKHELVTETEEEKRSDPLLGSGYSAGGEKRSGTGQDGKTPEPDPRTGVPASYPIFSPYPYSANGATVPSSLGSKVPVPPHPGSLSSLMMYPGSESLAQPPPAHMGIPPVHIDPKTGLPRPPMYAIPPPPGQFSHHLYSDISQMQWNGHPSYPMSTGYRGPYPGLSSSPLARFSPPGLSLHHPGMHHSMQHHAIVTPGPKQEIPNSENHRHHPLLHGHDQSSNASDSQTEVTPKKPHIKKPLNAFMLFMKEQRAKVAAECTLKESAAINQILGRRWHALDRSEQAKYYEMARKEKELHLQLYPGWSARDNYATHTKKKKRKREQQASEQKNAFGQDGYAGEYLHPSSGALSNNNSSSGFDLSSSPRQPHQQQHHQPQQVVQYSHTQEAQKQECTNPKKCRARFGLDQQSQWCKPCRRKKKCIRFMTGEDGSGSDDDEDDDGEGGGSIATIDSTTDIDGSSQGSPAPSSSTTAEDGIQHPGVSQSEPTSPSAAAGSHQPQPIASRQSENLLHQNHPPSDSNQDSLHSTVTTSAGSLAANSSNTAHVPAVLAT